MRAEDAEFAALNVQLSLEQFLNAATGAWTLSYQDDVIAAVNHADTLNVCRNNFMPSRDGKDFGAVSSDGMNAASFLPSILVKTPVPGLATGLGEIPRFRSEIGMFLGVSASVNAASIDGGFGKNQTQTGGVGGIEANARFGFGLDGVLNQAGDGLVFVQAGFRQDATSSNKIDGSTGTVPAGSIAAAIPARSGYNFRMRLPFWLIPGDLLIAGPILLLVSKDALSRMAVSAGNGGLIPWQSGIATPVGRFQFVLGREVGVTYYGTKENGIPTPSGTQLLSYASTKFDFPLLEYRPFRTFSLDQTSSLMFQLTGGFDVPHSATVIYPVGEPLPELKPVWNIGVRVIFDWRHYF
jgi:hypothetical protein